SLENTPIGRPRHTYLRTRLSHPKFISDCTLWAAFAILYYDYLLTFKDEVGRYWTKPSTWTLGTVLFFINRYSPIFGYIPVVLLSFWSWPTPNRLKVCFGLNQYHQYLLVFVQIIVGCIAALRTYAIYACSRFILVLILSVGLGMGAYGLFSVLSQHSTPFTLSDLPPTGCQVPATPPILSSTMISRLMFNLRDPKLLCNVRDSQVRSAVSQLIFEIGCDTHANSRETEHERSEDGSV
ncbi:hypothetical protein CPB84DRAFT_1792093, partial [Gymnopilus junonius]